MKLKRILLSAGSIVIGFMLFAPTHAVAAESTLAVLTKDAEDIVTQIGDLATAVENVATAAGKVVIETKKAMDLGQYMDAVFDVSFLFPKPRMSSDVVKAIPKDSDGGTSVAGVSVPSTSSITGGSKSDDEKFEDAEKVDKSIQNNLTVDGQEKKGDGENMLELVQDVASVVTGSGNEQNLKAEEVTKKKAKLAQSKQAFARYALAAALVHRTLAHRTNEDSKQHTEEKTAEATTQRKVQASKVHSNLLMADTYNRLLMSQAAANGLSAFHARDEMEAKIDYNLRGVTDAASLGSTPGGALGAAGGLLGM